jgi:hypothetical protein
MPRSQSCPQFRVREISGANREPSGATITNPSGCMVGAPYWMLTGLRADTQDFTWSVLTVISAPITAVPTAPAIHVTARAAPRRGGRGFDAMVLRPLPAMLRRRPVVE